MVAGLACANWLTVTVKSSLDAPPGNFVPSNVITSPSAYVLPPLVQTIDAIAPVPLVVMVNSAPDPLGGATLV